MTSLTSYRGIQVLDPDPIGDGGLAVQNDLKIEIRVKTLSGTEKLRCLKRSERQPATVR